MLKTGSWLVLHLFILSLMGLTESNIELLSLFETSDHVLQSSISQPDKHIAVSVSNEDLNGVSSSILSAETWLKSHVLAHYPAARITTVVVANSGCQDQSFSLVLPSLKNVYHSLKRWGLEKEIKVSVAFSLECLSLQSSSSNEANLKPLLEYLQSVNSTYSLISPHFSHQSLSFLVSSHLDSMKKNLGFSYPENVNVLAPFPRGRKLATKKLSLVPTEVESDVSKVTSLQQRDKPEFESQLEDSQTFKCALLEQNCLVWKNTCGGKPKKRKLSFVDPSVIDPFPLIDDPSMHTLVGSPTPSPFPTPMPSSTTLAPQSLAPPPPASSPIPSTLPPCNNPTERVPPEAQLGQVQQKSWCVAKPSVPAVKLQQALEYACGEGGADCEEISPAGKCYNPDNVVAHASYAFNSYWQKQKRNGGTCFFGGTAMLVASDPSFLHCRFILS